MRKLLLLTIGAGVAAICATLSIPLLFASGADGACLAPTAEAAPVTGRSVVVGASMYGGPGDPSTPGRHGYRGDDLAGRMAFAELSTNWEGSGAWDFAALGDLPRGARLRITATVDGRSRTVVAEKLDIGRGGPPIQGRPRAIDLWWETVEALGLDGRSGTWSGTVRIQRTDAPATKLGAQQDCDPGLPVGPLAQRIVAIARDELAKDVHDGGRNCVSYNNCNGQPWCASFVSHVWRRAGVPMPDTAASNVIWTWASQHGQVLGPDEPPQPGDAILYGTGPSSTATSVHVGLVETVGPDGRITTIEGNLSDRVKRNGPFHPRDAVAAGEPASVYAYARPRR